MQFRKPFFRTLFFILLLTCLLIGMVGNVGFRAHAARQMLGSMEILINEVAWAGTIASIDDDWIELYNPDPDTTSFVDMSGWQLVSASGSLNIIFPAGTVIYGDSYFLIETRELVTSVPADFISPYPWSLSDVGDIIRLRKLDGSIVDTANSDGGAWPAGTLISNKSMERFRPLPDSDQIWTSYAGSGDPSIVDATGTNLIYGTPGLKNWAYDITPPTVTTITSDDPDYSLVGQDVTVSVTVTSPLSTPTGTVVITVQNSTPTCTITLSGGSGSCVIQFASFGTKVINADYIPDPGDLDHAPSSDTESHEVKVGSTITITSSSPDPAQTYQNVTVEFTVTGDSIVAPTGTVSITGANTTCTITISPTSNNTSVGDCTVKFYSAGSKVITATYNGDDRYSKSTDTEAQTILPSPTSTPYVFRTSTPRPQPPPPLLGINEFVPRPGTDWNNDGVVNTGDEYIELLNHGVINVVLSGYRLDDEANIGSNPYALPNITLKPGERIVFYGSQTGLLLSDGGDGVRLLKSNGQLVDAYNYSVVEFPDQSFCRLPDNGGLDDWNENCYPTPGLRNSLSGSILRPPTLVDNDQVLCPIADSLPQEFFLAECTPFGNNIWNRYYWDKFGWYGEEPLPFVNGKWGVFAE